MSRSDSQRSSKRSHSREKKRIQSDKDDAMLSCLYIGNIDKKVNNEKLREHFEKYGELQYCYIVNEPTSSEVKISRGYGFAKFKNPDDTIKAKNELDGLDLYNRRIKVEVSKRNKPREATPGRYLGRKRSPVRHRRRRSYSGSSSDSYRKRKQRKHHRDRDDRHYKRRDHSRSRSKDRDHGYRSKRRSYSEERRQHR